jgi:fumarate reductase subunit C
MNVRLYVLQRLSALVMVPLIAVHLVTIFYAMGNGLTAAEILGRTRGSLLWGGFYGLFVVAAAVHGAIGLRAVLGEWTRLAAGTRDFIMWAFGLLLLGLGWRAVMAVVA